MSLLSKIYSQDGARAAVRCADVTISYSRFCADIDALAIWLQNQGVKPEHRVAIRFHAG